MRSLLALLVLALLVSIGGTASAKRAPKPTFGDVPIDRFIHGQILEMKGRKVRILYDFDDPEQAKDFYYNRPFQREGHGSFGIAGGLMRGAGGGGLCTIIAFESDVTASAIVRLERPVRDAGLYLRDHRGTLRATLFALRETFFSRKDNQALGLNRIIAIGSVPSAMKGSTEFRYVAASGTPEVAEGDNVPVTIIRKGKVNTMRAHKEEWSGPDVGRPHGDVEIGLFTNGGRAFFDDLLIEGELSEEWLRDRRVALFLANDIQNPANRLRKRDKKALALLRDFQGGEGDLAELLEEFASEKVNVFVREAMGTALAASQRVAEVLPALKPLLLSKDRATRTFAGRILDAAIDMDFGFEPDGDEEERVAAVDRFIDYYENRDAREEKGQSFVGGAWRTPEELEKMRLTWEYAREIRTRHFLIRTNLAPELAEDKAKLLEACYDVFRQHLGREPDPAKMPLRIYVFAKNLDYENWCKRNDQERWAKYYRLILGEEQLGLTTWQKQRNPGIVNVAARLYLRATIGFTMPLWYEEGLAEYFSGPGCYYWIRGKLTVEKSVPPNTKAYVAGRVGKPEWFSIGDLVGAGTGELRDPNRRRLFYAQSQALFAYLNQAEKYNSRWSEFIVRCRAADLQEDTRRRLGALLFRESFEGKLEDLEKDWIEWLKLP